MKRDVLMLTIMNSIRSCVSTRYNRPLNHLQAKLDGRLFFRANRHQILNVKAVRAIHPWFGGRLLAEIDGGQRVTLSRRRARAFRELMSV